MRRWAGRGPAAKPQRRGRGVLTARGTRREPIPGGSVAASMPPHGPASGEATAPDSWSAAFLKVCSACVADKTFAGCVLGPVCRSACDGAMMGIERTPGDPTSARRAHHVLLATKHTDHLDRSLPAHRRGTLRGMDAA
ncbi:hypothetical protein XaplCFBP3123_13215 [Xanthomonas arboricola pv. populi]|nr:hypothetical protein XaplCFBP3123_13215 [Xanthomonas arboricola pv. populi]